MHTMQGMPPHVIVIGMPHAIMRFIVEQHILSISRLIMPVGIISMPRQLIISMSIAHIAFIASMSVPSAGIITHFIPLSVMVHVMWHIIGIIEAIGIEPIMAPGMFMEGMDMGI